MTDDVSWPVPPAKGQNRWNQNPRTCRGCHHPQTPGWQSSWPPKCLAVRVKIGSIHKRINYIALNCIKLHYIELHASVHIYLPYIPPKKMLGRQFQSCWLLQEKIVRITISLRPPIVSLSWFLAHPPPLYAGLEMRFTVHSPLYSGLSIMGASHSPSSSSSQSSGFLAFSSTMRFSSTQLSGFLSLRGRNGHFSTPNNGHFPIQLHQAPNFQAFVRVYVRLRWGLFRA